MDRAGEAELLVPADELVDGPLEQRSCTRMVSGKAGKIGRETEQPAEIGSALHAVQREDLLGPGPAVAQRSAYEPETPDALGELDGVFGLSVIDEPRERRRQIGALEVEPPHPLGVGAE